MNKSFRLGICALFFTFPAFNLVAADDPTAVCMAMVADAAHNVSVKTTSSAYLDSVFDNYCHADGSTSKSDTDFSAALPDLGNFNLNNGDVHSSYSNFCKTYKSTQVGQSATFTFQSQVIASALGNANECLKIATSGNFLTYKMTDDPTTLILKFAIGSGRTLKIRGISGPETVACEGPVLSGSGNVAFNSGQGLTLTSLNSQYSIRCIRRPDSRLNGVSHFARATILVDTDAGSMTISWPEDPAIPLTTAKVIQAEIDALTATVNSDQKSTSDQFEQLAKVVPNAVVLDSCIRHGFVKLNQNDNSDGSQSCPSDHPVWTGVIPGGGDLRSAFWDFWCCKLKIVKQ